MTQTGTDKAEVLPQNTPMLTPDFTKQYNRQKTIVQNAEAGIPAQQGPKRNPQAQAPSGMAPAAYTSHRTGEYDDSIEILSRHAGRIKLKDEDSKYPLLPPSRPWVNLTHI